MPLKSTRGYFNTQLADIVYYRNITIILILRISRNRKRTAMRFVIIEVKLLISKKYESVHNS